MISQNATGGESSMFIRNLIERGLLLIAAAQFVSNGYALAETPAFHTDSFQALNMADRVHVVLAGLREHEGDLENSSFDIKEIWTNYLPHGTIVDKRDIKLLTIGRKYLYDIVSVNQMADGSEMKMHVRAGWDGETSVVWKSIGSNLHAGAVIGQSDPNNDPKLTDVRWFTSQLGTHREPPSARSVADWLELLIEQRNAVCEANAVNEDGNVRLKVALTDSASDRFDFTLDPLRGFVVTHYVCSIPYGDHGISKLNDVTSDHFECVNNVWTPSQITRDNFDESGRRIASIVFQVSRCELGSVKEPDLTVKLDPGTLVVDNTKQLAYEIGSDGTHVSRPYLNTKTGKTPPLIPSTRDD